MRLVPPVDPLPYLLASAASPGLSMRGVEEAWLSKEGRGPAAAPGSAAFTSERVQHGWNMKLVSSKMRCSIGWQDVNGVCVQGCD